jgi:hypothetical protein
LTPSEVWIFGDIYFETERERQRESWRRAAFLGATIINMSGKTSKSRVKPEQLINLSEGMQQQDDVDIEKMREEAMAVFRLHKSKFWGKLGGTSLDKVKVYGEN